MKRPNWILHNIVLYTLGELKVNTLYLYSPSRESTRTVQPPAGVARPKAEPTFIIDLQMHLELVMIVLTAAGNFLNADN